MIILKKSDRTFSLNRAIVFVFIRTYTNWSFIAKGRGHREECRREKLDGFWFQYESESQELPWRLLSTLALGVGWALPTLHVEVLRKSYLCEFHIP
ncbi:MAG TPA: hypothetical protein V6D48_19730 [Oculatellaceae cyanobacterium]